MGKINSCQQLLQNKTFFCFSFPHNKWKYEETGVNSRFWKKKEKKSEMNSSSEEDEHMHILLIEEGFNFQLVYIYIIHQQKYKSKSLKKMVKTYIVSQKKQK